MPLDYLMGMFVTPLEFARLASWPMHKWVACLGSSTSSDHCKENNRK